MGIQDLGAIGELVAAIATVATLVYLALQVRASREATLANTRQMRGQAFVELSEVVRAQLTWLRDHPEEFDIITRATADWSSLTLEEQRVATVWNMDEANYHELAFVLWQEGAIDEDSYLVREEYFLSLLIGNSGRRYWWDNFVYLLDKRFIDRINTQLERAEREGAKPMQENQPMYAPIERSQDGA